MNAPTFIYLKNSKVYVNLQNITCITIDKFSMDVFLTGDNEFIEIKDEEDKAYLLSIINTPEKEKH